MISPFDRMVGPNWRLAKKRRTQKKRRARFSKVVRRQAKLARGAHNKHSWTLA